LKGKGGKKNKHIRVNRSTALPRGRQPQRNSWLEKGLPLLIIGSRQWGGVNLEKDLKKDTETGKPLVLRIKKILKKRVL